MAIVAEARLSAGKSSDAQGLCGDALRLDKKHGGERQEQLSKLAAAIEARLKRERKVRELQEGLEANPKHRCLRERLVLSCLLELESASEAREHLTADCDQSLQRYVPLAAQPMEALPEKERFDLADWYRRLGNDTESAFAKAVAWGRAVRLYETIQGEHDIED